LGYGKYESLDEKYSTMQLIHDDYILDATTGRIGRVANVPGDRDDCHDNDDSNSAGTTLGQTKIAPKWKTIFHTGWSIGHPVAQVATIKFRTTQQLTITLTLAAAIHKKTEEGEQYSGSVFRTWEMKLIKKES
jgi:hypothetical protein